MRHQFFKLTKWLGRGVFRSAIALPRAARRPRLLSAEPLEARLALSVVPLVVSEIMYNPADPTVAEIAAGHTDNESFEFIEIQNAGAQTLQLQGFSLSSGVQYTFGALTLAPGELAAVVRDLAAFTFRYGADMRVAGQFGGALSNGGERLVLKDAGQQVLIDFSYGDWYPETDGSGASLMIVDPAADSSTWGNAQSWLPSATNGGSPGRLNQLPDLTPPSVPQYLRPVAIDTGRVVLQWNAAVDLESGVTEYRWYRDGQRIGQSSTPTLADATVQPAMTYAYQVSAVNGDGAESATSERLAVFVPPAGSDPRFASGVSGGKVTDNHITEASGLAASRTSANVLWTHNDSSGTATLHALNVRGSYLGTFPLSGVQAVDCEDMAIGPGPVAGIDYLYLGDIGDNSSTRPSIRIYRVAEPALRWDGGVQSLSLSSTEILTLRYPDGAHDAETLLCDPWSGDLYVITKELAPNRIYRAAAASLIPGNTITMTLVGVLNFPLVNGGDISANGREILLRHENSVQLYPRAPGQSVASSLAGTPIPAPVIGTPDEPNGEAIAFDAAGSGYFTLSEGTDQPLYYFRRTSMPVGNTRTWVGGAGNEWMTAQNWLDGQVPQAGDTLVFAGAAAAVTVNNFPPGTCFPEIVFQDGSFTVSGNMLALATPVGMAIDVGAGATCVWQSPLTGSGPLRRTGSGTLVLQTAANHMGGTTVQVGTVIVGAADALPAGGALTIGSGGTLVLGSDLGGTSQAAGTAQVTNMAAGTAAAPLPNVESASRPVVPTVGIHAPRLRPSAADAVFSTRSTPYTRQEVASDLSAILFQAWWQRPADARPARRLHPFGRLCLAMPALTPSRLP